jgi:hypothetical protein
MRKVITASPILDTLGVAKSADWLRLDVIATVEVTSEDPAYPIESAFAFTEGPGWRAAGPGTQTIRLVFDMPQRVRRIWLRFVETELERTHEFALRYAEVGRLADQGILRQQWNFNPQGSTSEIEDYRVDLPNVSVMEFSLDPDQGRGVVVATLAEWRLA